MENAETILSLKNNIYYESTHSSKKMVLNNHYHSWFELYYLEDGSGNYLIEDCVYEIMAGDIVLIPPNMIHKTAYDSSNHSRILLYLSGSSLPPFVTTLLNGNYVYRNLKVSEKILPILKNIEFEYLNWDDYSSVVINSYVTLLFTQLCRNQNYYKQTPQKVRTHITNVLQYIHLHYNSNITLSQVAKLFFISPEHLSRIFKKETGLNFSEYLIAVRLKQAELLLKQDNKKTISDIAYSCGFHDSNYFSHIFKRSYGVSPLQYKKHKQPPKGINTEGHESDA